MKKTIFFFALYLMSLVTMAQTIMGDMDGDGKITMADANAVVSTYLGKSAVQYLANVSPMYQVDNAPIAGTWYKTSNSYMVLSSDGVINDNSRTNVVKFEFLPAISKLLTYDVAGNPDRYYDVLKLDDAQLVLGRNGDFERYTHEKPIDDKLPGSTIQDEMIYQDNTEFLLSGIYYRFASFVNCEMALEKMALAKETSSYKEKISPDNQYVNATFREGYAVISNCNYCISYSSDAAIKAHAIVVRSIVYYMMTQLWGDLPYTLKPVSAVDVALPVATEAEIVSDCIAFLSANMDNMEVGLKSNGILNKNTSLALLIEMKLANGTYKGEYPVSDLYSRTYDFILYNEATPAYRVVDAKYVDLLIGEYNLMQLAEKPEYRFENLSNVWNADERYGVWNAMKRLGLAKPNIAFGMSPRLKFPYPTEILMTTSGLVQDPFYK